MGEYFGIAEETGWDLIGDVIEDDPDEVPEMDCE